MATRLPVLVSAAMLAAIAVLYLVLVAQDDSHGHGERVAFFASCIVVATLLAIGGSLAGDPYWRRLQFGIAAAITVICAWLAALSIGMLFLPALLLLVFALTRG
jgi:hypothetical protein